MAERPSFAPAGIVTLTTDFGNRDGYVGAMKGVVLGLGAGLSLVDIAHEVEPQSVAHGAVVLRAACPRFPRGTVHVGVVDPGVGTKRAGIVVLAGGHAFVGPDNGLFTLAAAALGEPIEARRIDVTGALRGIVADVPSSTFHGRDVFAPVGAALAAGTIDAGEIGPIHEPTALPTAPPRAIDGGLEGTVTYVDRFGNAVTNLSAGELAAGGLQRAHVEVSGRTVAIVATYGEAEPGGVCALVGSEGFLEIAVRDGSARDRLGLTHGATVRVRGGAA